VTQKEVVDARKTAMNKKEALTLASQVDEIYAAKGTKVVHLDLRKSKPSEAEILGAMLGPTGNLRAPTIRVGKKLIVGFNEDTYSKLL
jgi:arsenate reductase-like glutaredoxin family protein